MQTFLVGIQGNRLGIFASEQSSCTVETVASTRSLFRCRPLRTALRMGRQFVSPTVSGPLASTMVFITPRPYWAHSVLALGMLRTTVHTQSRCKKRVVREGANLGVRIEWILNSLGYERKMSCIVPSSFTYPLQHSANNISRPPRVLQLSPEFSSSRPPKYIYTRIGVDHCVIQCYFIISWGLGSVVRTISASRTTTDDQVVW